MGRLLDPIIFKLYPYPFCPPKKKRFKKKNYYPYPFRNSPKWNLLGFFLWIQNTMYIQNHHSILLLTWKIPLDKKHKLGNFTVKSAFHLDQSLRFQDLGPRNKMEYMEASLETQNKWRTEVSTLGNSLEHPS